MTDKKTKETLNVSLIGLSNTMSTFVQGVCNASENYHWRYPMVGTYDHKSIRFCSVFTMDPSHYGVTGQKLSTIILNDSICSNKFVSQTRLNSYLENVGGNPNTLDDEYERQGGSIFGRQNPIVRPIPTTHSEDDKISINRDTLIKILSGDCGESGINEYLKADVAIVTIPDLDQKSQLDYSVIFSVLEELDIPFVVVDDSLNAIDYPDNLPFVNGELVGQIDRELFDALIHPELEARGLTIEDLIETEHRFSGLTLNQFVSKIEGFGNQNARVSIQIEYDEASSIAATLFDVVRFLQVAKENNLTGEIKGLSTIYSKNRSMIEYEAKEELQALASGNLMALGKYYQSNGNTFKHK